MVSFAVGGLLGDTLFHLLPEIFLGEVPEGEVRAVLIEPNKNLLLGVAIMVGFVTFVAMDKGLRIATGGEGHSHDHGSHDHSNGSADVAKAVTSGSNTDSSDAGAVRSRKSKASNKDTPAISTAKTVEEKPKEIKLSAYLNIIADFTHNITDGLAMSSSFYASPTLGATTTLAVFCHEIPHEVGDFALLIQGGMSKYTAMGLQFVTALGAVLGTIIGIMIQEYGGSGAAETVVQAGNHGLWGTSLQWGDMLLPFTAGTFLYVGTVGVIPEILETGPERWKEAKGTAMQFLAMAAGAGIMLGYVRLSILRRCGHQRTYADVNTGFHGTRYCMASSVLSNRGRRRLLKTVNPRAAARIMLGDILSCYTCQHPSCPSCCLHCLGFPSLRYLLSSQRH